MEADVAKITKRAEEFKDLPDALQRNLQIFLTLTMDILAAVHQKVKTSSLPDVSRQTVRPVVHCQMLDRVADLSTDNRVAPQKVEGAHHLCGEPQVQDVARRVLVSRAAGCGDRAVAIAVWWPVLCMTMFSILRIIDRLLCSFNWQG